MDPVRAEKEPQGETVRHYYQDSGVARTYDGDRFTGLAGRTLNRLEKRALLHLLQPTIARSMSSLVLDAPCGTGRVTEWLLESGFNVIGVDISGPMIDVARSRCARFGNRVRFARMDLENLALPGCSVDLVTCVRLFHHLDTEQRGRILQELGRVSRDAVVVNVSLSTPFYRWRRRLKRALRQGISRQSSTPAEIDREAGRAGLYVDSRRFVARHLSEDLFLSMRKKSAPPPVEELSASVATTLSAQGHIFVGGTEPPRAVSLRRKGGALLASLQFGYSRSIIVLKEVRSDAMIASADELLRVHQRIRVASPRLAESLPEFLGVLHERGLLVIEYVPGPTLEAALNHALLPHSRQRATDGLAATAEVLAEFHRWPAADFGVPCFPRLNRSFLPDMDAYWKASQIVAFLERRHRQAGALYEHLKPAFFDREGDRLVPYDSQPKNVVLGKKRVSFIDLDYFGGNPAISIAAFLGSLDRLGLRRPPGSFSGTSLWKRRFLESYSTESNEGVTEDLVFFYPWTLLQQQASLAASHPALSRYTARYYARRLDAFMAALETLPWDRVRRSPGLLFR